MGWNYDEQTNLERQLANLDLIDKVWKKSCTIMAAYQYKIACYFNDMVQDKVFKVGDLVLC